MKLSFTKPLLGLALFAAALLLEQACSPKGAPVSELGKTRFVPQSQPDSVDEYGIGQDPATGGIFLQWYSAAGAVGYKVYRTDTTDAVGKPVEFLLIADVNSAGSLNDTTYVDHSGIGSGRRYYYFIVPYGSDRTPGDRSDTVDYSLLDRPSLSRPVDNDSVSSDPVFAWHDATGGGYTVIRVKDMTAVPERYIWVSMRFQLFDSYPDRMFDFDSAAFGKLLSGHTYRWRVDRFNIDGTGRPFEGARSRWSSFVVKSDK